jgi:hypothetical protein
MTVIPTVAARFFPAPYFVRGLRRGGPWLDVQPCGIGVIISHLIALLFPPRPEKPVYHPPRHTKNAPLIRTLSQRDLFLLFVGSVIGSGIFYPWSDLSPARRFRGFALLRLDRRGVLSLLGALTYANSPRAIPKPAGSTATSATDSAVFRPSSTGGACSR